VMKPDRRDMRPRAVGPAACSSRCWPERTWCVRGNACVPTGAGISITAPAHTAGANKGCIFLGKIINLHNKDFNVVTALGRQYAAGTTSVDVKNLTEAAPAVVNFPTAISTYSYTNEARILEAVSVVDATVSYRAIAFINELGGGVTALSTSSGSRGVELYGIAGSASTNSTAPGAILGGTPMVKIDGGVRLCFEGGNGAKFEVTVGADGDQTNTNVLIHKGVSDVCEDA